MQQHTTSTAKRFSLIFLSILCIALIGFAYMTASRASDTLTKDSDGYYAIATSADLVKFRDMVNAGSSDINGKLTADIDLSNVCSASLGSWTPIGNDTAHSYSGTFDGQGHALKNLFVSMDISRAGLFGTTSAGSEVKNLTVSGSVICTGEDCQAGGIIGNNGGKVSSCTAKDSVSVSGRLSHAGGIAGDNTGSITNCNTAGSVSATGPEGIGLGGIAGFNTGSITNCASAGSVSGTTTDGNTVYCAAGGGIAGNNVFGELTSCTATGKVSMIGFDVSAGGIVGSFAISSVTNCAATGDVLVSGDLSAAGITSQAGGVAGSNTEGGTMRNCTSQGNVSAAGFGSSAGGLVGSAATLTAANCTATGNVSAAGSGSSAGGLAGYETAFSSITNCGWLKTCADSAFGYSDTSCKNTDITSFDQAALDSGMIVVSCLPGVSSLDVRPGGSGSVTLTTYPRAASGAASRVISADSTVDPSTLADVSVSGDKVTVTGKTEGSGTLSMNVTIAPTLFSGDCSGKTAATIFSSLSVPVTVSTKPVSGGGTGNCNAGFGALSLLAVLPLMWRRKK